MMPTQGLADWYSQTIAGSPVWAGIGFFAVLLILTVAIGVIGMLVWGQISRMTRVMRRKQRQNTQGYFVAIAPIKGARGKASSRALMDNLQRHIANFSFGAPIEVVSAPNPRVTAKFGKRDAARNWLRDNACDLIAWGYREDGKQSPIIMDVLSREGSLTAKEAKYHRIALPPRLDDATETEQIAAAYMLARALQPGLADATAFRPEKLHGAAKILGKCIAQPDNLPAETLAVMEADYCRMALHLGTEAHLEDVVRLRRARLGSDEVSDTMTTIATRLDLGRALLKLSETQFDTARVREGMDHLKIAIDLLRKNPTLQLATQATLAAQQGQSMLQAHQRFSVMGGGV
jgi:hypothetical protein